MNELMTATDITDICLRTYEVSYKVTSVLKKLLHHLSWNNITSLSLTSSLAPISHKYKITIPDSGVLMIHRHYFIPSPLSFWNLKESWFLDLKIVVQSQLLSNVH